MYRWFVIIIVTVLTIWTYGNASGCKGCVSLDEYSFEKVVPRFASVVVKFDAAYPYGDKHDTYTKLAEELASNPDILIAQVQIKDYGDKENESLGRRYGINSKEDLPAIRLFLQGKREPIGKFMKDDEWSLDNLRNLIRDNTKVYLGLPGCLEKYDKLAEKFMITSDQKKIISKVEKILETEESDDKTTGKTYLLIMKKLMENGKDFIEQETVRLMKILRDGKVKEEKKKQLSTRLNILHSFSMNSKEEL